MRLPASFTHPLFALFLSGFMSCIITGIATWKVLGFVPDFFWRWMAAWTSAWPVAFVLALVFAPVIRKLAVSMCEPPANP